MKAITLPLILVLSISTAVGQEYDSIQVNTWTEQASAHEKQSDFDSAIFYYEKVEQALMPIVLSAKDSLLSVEYIRVMDKLMIMSFFSGKFENSTSIGHQALKAMNTIWPEGAQIGAQIHFSLGNIYLRFKQTDSARYYLEQCLKVHKTFLPETDGRKYDVIQVLAGVYAQEGNYAKALDSYNQVLDFYKQNLDPSDNKIGNTYIYIGHLYQDYLGDLQKALEYHLLFFQQRLATNDKISRPVGVAYETIGISYNLLGRYDKSLDYYLKALSIYKKVLAPESPTIANVMHNIGSTLNHKGNYTGESNYHEEALTYHSDALAMRKMAYPEVSYKVGSSYKDMGITLSALNRHDEALSYHKRALKVLEEVFDKDNLELAAVNIDMGDALDKSGNYKQAMTYYMRALEIVHLSFTNKHPTLAVIHNNIARIYARQNDTQLSLSHFHKALMANVKGFDDTDIMANPSPEMVMTAINNDSYLTSLNGKANQLKLSTTIKDHELYADSAWQLSVALVDHIRKEYKSDDMKLNLQARSLPLYQSMIDNLYDLYEQYQDPTFLRRIFNVVERSKGTVLFESLKADDALSFAGLSKEINDKENALRSSINFFENIIYELSNQPDSVNSTKLLDYRSSLLDKQDSYDSLLNFLEHNYPEYYRIRYATSSIEIPEVQQTLDGETLLLEYFISNNYLYRIGINAETFEVDRIAINKDFENDALKYLGFLNNRSVALSSEKNTVVSYLNEGHDLYQTLLGGRIMQDSKYRKLLVIPDGVLGYLPFEGLVSDKVNSSMGLPDIPYLIKDYNVRYAYSAGLSILDVSKRNKNTEVSFIGFAPSYPGDYLLASSRGLEQLDSATRAGVSPLVYNQREVEGIGSLLKGEVIIGTDASEKAFKTNAKRSKILHLAMHGLTNDHNPLYSGLLFAPADTTEQEDNFLYAYELYNMDLSAEMAVLSACNTGWGRLRKGEGIMSLSRAFRYAGCPNLVMSLWQADDQAAFDLMKVFYQGIDEGLPKDEALRKAKLAYIDTHDNIHPYFWANFVLIGDDKPIAMDEWPKMFYFILAFMVLIIIVLLARKKVFPTS
ncbi:CHAT domain-containing protein [Fulvivirga sp. M361]|uniref:CHAT domain-containing protein n=1 Tax=Fulvivirga sp. M361 TaxID=2594266 RepID=UPI00117A9E68|nr:CHAT domain-containing tetratricopeptide repeat protein [Fulvivirga sp. M361]TRX62615.1 CHAT domain-containing protein [Fulvivirga sp. M361]